MCRRAVLAPCAVSTTLTVMRSETTGGVCGMWSLSPRSSCSICLPGVRVTCASVWPAPKCRWLKSLGIGLSSGGKGASMIRW